MLFGVEPGLGLRPEGRPSGRGLGEGVFGVAGGVMKTVYLPALPMIGGGVPSRAAAAIAGGGEAPSCRPKRTTVTRVYGSKASQEGPLGRK